ncbi:MAG: tRNA (N6-threonylcarbamoyladenosine(37)-N6)-methyltransferase TrmO [Aerococcus sp.]|nr:tRNA (N6-threonylcarbamoyladenosine(37)-N6)-methyltransferase TrmO [Aerococcus sp.]
MDITPVAYVETPFHEKFGIPRQGVYTPHVTGRIIFTDDYQNADYIRGIEEFERLWLIWGFSKVRSKNLKTTVRPPRLGGKERRGVFATRSPFRPNRLGLTTVELLGVITTEDGKQALRVKGLDLLDGTPIYDIKPYSPEADAFPEADAGFIQSVPFPTLKVQFAPDVDISMLSEADHTALVEILTQDPRPARERTDGRLFGVSYGDYNVRFSVQGDQLTIQSIDRLTNQPEE